VTNNSFLSVDIKTILFTKITLQILYLVLVHLIKPADSMTRVPEGPYTILQKQSLKNHLIGSLNGLLSSAKSSADDLEKNIHFVQSSPK
jgi:hypothetical protein